MLPYALFRLLAVPAVWLLFVLTACGTLAPMPAPREETLAEPRAGNWTLEYSGGCTGRETEPLLITQLDETAIVFDDFTLRRNEAGEYVGTANRIAPMPVDGREIGYTITFRLKATEAGGFAGTETVVEGGGHGLDCPVELRYLGEE